MATRWSIAVAFACAVAGGCGSQDLGSDPQWGQGFSARPADPGNPDAPTSVEQACMQFGGAPYAYPSLEDLQARLARRWVGCGDNPGPSGPISTNFWPQGFTGVQLDPAGTWQALRRASDGSVEPATVGNASGTYVVTRYPGDPVRYAGSFIVYLLPGDSTDMDSGEQWQGDLEESPEMLVVTSAHTGDSFRFSSAAP